jgi:hypothetical protein
MRKEKLVLSGDIVREITLSFDDNTSDSQVEETLAQVGVITGIMEVAPLAKATDSRGATIGAELDFDGLRSIEFLFGPNLNEAQVTKRFKKILELLTDTKTSEW